MNVQQSVRWLVAMSSTSAVLLLGACGQQSTGGEPAAASGTSQALTQDHVTPAGQSCAPTGKHANHAAFACATCHQCAGTLSFDPALAGPTAAFDATTKNCSNVACHSVPAGTYTYYPPGAVDPVAVPYGGQGGGAGANWYAAAGAAGCSACHGYPPTYNGAAYAWHSGQHAANTTVNGNACQLCHPDATGAYVSGGPPSYAGTSGGQIASCPAGTYCAAPGTITNPSLHGNGVVNVTPSWTTACFNCHQ